MAAAVFIDTWGWTELGHRRATRHDEVRRFYQSLVRQRVAIVTTDYVLDETITLLFRREVFDEAVRFLEAILSAAEQGWLVIERITSERFTRAWSLRKRFQDKPTISFTDLASMTVMQELGISDVLTEDEHFTQVGMGFRRVP